MNLIMDRSFVSRPAAFPCAFFPNQWQVLSFVCYRFCLLCRNFLDRFLSTGGVGGGGRGVKKNKCAVVCDGWLAGAEAGEAGEKCSIGLFSGAVGFVSGPAAKARTPASFGAFCPTLFYVTQKSPIPDYPKLEYSDTRLPETRVLWYPTTRNSSTLVPDYFDTQMPETRIV